MYRTLKVNCIIVLVSLAGRISAGGNNGGHLEIITNGILLNTTKVNSSVKLDNAVAWYHYQEGEMVNTVCRRSQNNNRSSLRMRIEYHDADGYSFSDLDDSKYAKSPTFRSLMKLEKNNSYLDCLFKQINRPNIMYRTYYIWKARYITPVDVYVDDTQLVLIPEPGRASHYRTYYYYVEGQKVQLKCVPRNPELKTKNITIINNYDSQFNTWCNSTGTYAVKIIFESELGQWFSENVRVLGLEAEKILYQYTSGYNQWTIHYQYSGYKTLQLTCVTKLRENTRLVWNRTRRRHSITPAVANDRRNSMITYNVTITLTEADDRTTLDCVMINSKNINNPKVIIMFHVSPPSETRSTQNIEQDIVTMKEVSQVTTSITERPDHTITAASSSDEPVAVEGNGNLGWIIGGVATTGVILSALMVQCYRYQKRIIPNENRCILDDTPIPPFPSQWNDNTGNEYSTIEDGVMMENNYYEMGDNDAKDSEYYTEIPSAGLGGAASGIEPPYAVVDKTKKARHKMLGNRQYANTDGTDYANLGLNRRIEETLYENSR